MRVLWLVNTMLPAYAAGKGAVVSGREGWLDGIYTAMRPFITGEEDAPVTLGVCYPAHKARRAEVADGVTWYAFPEDTSRPEHYPRALEKHFAKVIAEFEPDIVHIFGTEFPHALAFVRAFEQPERTLIGLQGICTEIARYYRADLPDQVFARSTLRDAVRRDSLEQQQEKMTVRGVRERGALLLAGHIGGRTLFDREFAKNLCPRACYHTLEETMRAPFYEGAWSLAQARRHEIFVAQGDYPLKGLHFLIRALPPLIRHYPDLHVTVGGYPVFDHPLQGRSKVQQHVRLKSLRAAKQMLPQDLRNSAYGEYLRLLIDHQDLWEHIALTGMLDAEQMRERYLSAHVAVCPSMCENSPNSVAEAMLLGTPVVASRICGIPSMIDDGKNGLLFTAGDPKDLALKIHSLFSDDALCERLSGAARTVAKKRHDPETNAAALMEVYREMTLR